MTKIAIVNWQGSFSDNWISYCDRHAISYVIVNPYRSDIISQVEGCSAFMWHFRNYNYIDMQCAKKIIISLETIGIKCFPDSKTCWHFDDKVAQKYLLEAVGAPLVDSYLFYKQEEALTWIEKTTFPKVFKLKGGAGSSNVKLAHNASEAVSFVKRCFGTGFRHYRWQEQFSEEWRKYRKGINTLRDLLRPLKYSMMRYPFELDNGHQRETGYALFQDFIPDNDYDTRICVIGNKAFGLRRKVRENDFRASGSGFIEYDRAHIDERCVYMAFRVNERLGAQCLAFDFLFDAKGEPLIVEISYGFSKDAYYRCEGFWTSDMVWHAGAGFDFCGWMVEQVI